MIICPLFLGAELYYNDMHLAFFEEATAPMRNVIEINHCRVGRYECSFGAKDVYKRQHRLDGQHGVGLCAQK